ncbi:hypothetical protein AB4402_00640 [Vibrio breoganii]|uniref:hypothetical protein n=1 Tax=Vibrio breoganii TaxID=553239 RepID=UPI000C853775|nr:hypothetical protein [Vibrio breoganii]PMP05266.1 hypothetical protein BCS94_14680 [Vibrio breoganii]
MQKWGYTLLCLVAVSLPSHAKFVEVRCPNNGHSSINIKVNQESVSIIHATESGINNSDTSIVDEMNVKDFYSVSFHEAAMNGLVLITGDVIFQSTRNANNHGRVLYRKVTLNKVIDDYEIIDMSNESFNKCLIIR